MAELGAIASAFTLVDAAASGAKLLWTFINDLRTAPKQLQALKEDVQSARQVLEGLRSYFETGRREHPGSLDLLFQRFGLLAAVDANKRILLDFSATIQRYTCHSKTGDLSKRDRLKVSFRKSKLEAFKVRLDASKNTITYAVTGATLVSSALASDDINKKLLAHQTALEEHSRQLNDIWKDVNDWTVKETEDPEEDDIPKTAAERDLTLEILPLLQATTHQAQQAIDSQINGTFQVIQSMTADTSSAAFAGTIGQNVDSAILKQRVGKAEAKNSSNVFIGKMSEGAAMHFWAGGGRNNTQAWTTGSPGGSI